MTNIDTIGFMLGFLMGAVPMVIIAIILRMMELKNE